MLVLPCRPRFCVSYFVMLAVVMAAAGAAAVSVADEPQSDAATLQATEKEALRGVLTREQQAAYTPQKVLDNLLAGVGLVPALAATLLDLPLHGRHLPLNLFLDGHPPGDDLRAGRLPEPASPASAVIPLATCSAEDARARDADLFAPIAPADLGDLLFGHPAHAGRLDAVAAAAAVAAAVSHRAGRVGDRGHGHGAGLIYLCGGADLRSGPDYLAADRRAL